MNTLDLDIPKIALEFEQRFSDGDPRHLHSSGTSAAEGGRRGRRALPSPKLDGQIKANLGGLGYGL